MTTNAFAADRSSVKAALNGNIDGFQIYEHMPDRAVAPCVIVSHGSPLLSREENDPFRAYTVHYIVWVVAGPGPNEHQLTQMETATQRVCELLLADNWNVDQVDQPVSFELNGTNLLATPINISSPFTIS